MRLGITLLLIALCFAPAAFAMGDKPHEDRERGGCIVGGCSGQLCVEASAGAVASTCEFRESYLCYGKHSACERQPDGACGWSPSASLTACLQSNDASVR